ncbi:tyrosine-type recombinase/integrase [Streptomyces broussonetiae]|uniref:Site-specific integrase n=1 Tax=Streptomyces broussonetiae TaxID=2686304 RepID=A0ABV5EAD8_9ACTN
MKSRSTRSGGRDPRRLRHPGSPPLPADDTLQAQLGQTHWPDAVAARRLREYTHTRYTACVNRYLVPGLGKKKLAKLSAKDVRTWLNQLHTTCQCCANGINAGRDAPLCCAVGTCCSKLLSPLTLTYIYSVLKSALKHAVREEEVPRNVARNVRTGTPRPRRFEPLTADEASQLLTAAQGHRLHALFELTVHTGLRKGELLGLRWEDLNLDAGTAAIRRTLQRTTAGGLTTLPTRPRPSERRIALPPLPPLAEASPRTEQREHATTGTAWQHSGHVFTTAQGRPIDPTNLTRTFTTLPRKVSLRHIRFHELKPSTGTLLLERGSRLVVIKDLLGHAHIGVTGGVYAHVRLHLQRQAIDTLGNAPDGHTHPDYPPLTTTTR